MTMASTPVRPPVVAVPAPAPIPAALPVTVAVAAGPAQPAHVPHIHVPQRAVAVSAQREREGAMGFLKMGTLAAALLVGAVFAVNHYFGGGKDSAQRVALQQAQQQLAKGDLDGAEKSLVSLMSGPMDAGVHRDAKKTLEDVRSRISAREDKAKKDQDAAVAAAEAQQRTAELQSLFDETTVAADALVIQENFGAALDTWKRFSEDNPDSPLASKVSSRTKEVLKAAQDAWEGLEARANSMTKLEEYQQAAATVGSAIEKFQGTRYYYDAQEKLAAINRLAGVETAVAGGGTKLSAKTQDSLLTIADLVKARRYNDAVREFDRALAAASGDDKAGLEAQRAEIAMQAALFGKLVTAVNGGFFAAHPIVMESGMKEVLVKATDDGLDIDIKDVDGKGGTSSRRWHQVEAEDMVGYFRAMELTLDDQVSLASFCYTNGMLFTAADALNDVIRKDATRKDAAFGLIARHRGIPVPSEGFVFYEGGWYTASELKFAKYDVDAKKGAQLVGQIDAKKAADGYALYKRVMDDAAAPADVKARLKAQFVGALKSRRTAILRKLQDPKTLVSPEVMRQLKKELNDRREDAIHLIYDKSGYADADKGHAGQARVDDAVNQVRQLWDNPLQVASTCCPSIAGLLAASQQTNTWLLELGASSNDAEQSQLGSLLADVNEALSLKNVCMTATDKAQLDMYNAIMAYNNRHPGFQEEEKECMRAINEYRFMMGRQALEAHAALGKAAREHAFEEYEKKYVALESPTPGRKTPADRCRLAGYTNGAIGENDTIGSDSGRSPFDAWYHSAADHRNMLSDLYNQVGAGKSWTYWTADFGRGGSAMTAPADTKVADAGKDGIKSGKRSNGTSGTPGKSGAPSVMGSGVRRGGVTGGSTGGAC
ncbi:MAG: CAP domain-containing protein [Planctomycetes bacterium]|nr:CAP domain-containing protein [Planctomycetota bacterium]